MTIHLQLTDQQQTELTTLAAQFNHELEDPNTPHFPKATTLQNLKEKLKAALFEQEGFEPIWENAQSKAVLLCLSHEKTEIRNLPWQIATKERPLLAIAKSAKNDLPMHQPSVGFPLKVLVMVASPEGVTRLAYEQEELELLRAFSPLMSQGLAQVHFTDDGSLEDLEEKLTENNYHILHYTGHGRYHEGKGTLALEDPITGKKKEASAEAFNQVLARVGRKGHRPELVVLSACQTAQGVEAGDLSGVADTLIQGGIPSVIAMSASILDNCASLFAAKLYGQLSDGFPLPDAFQQARLEIRKYELSLELAKVRLAPGQWLIPQLLLNEKVEQLVNKNSPKETLDFKNDVQYIKGEKALVDLRVRPKNYVFVGRRKEKRTALQQLKAGRSILLRGQGGVGKTALAEHLAIRLLAGNQRIKVFTFSEKTPAGQSLLDRLQNYLTKEKRDFKVVSELALIPKQMEKFYHLLDKVSKQCDPVFLFDNIETFQKFDTEKQLWVWHQEKHEDVFQLMQILDQQSPFPLIITGRYPIAEFPDLEICNMNTVPFSDFFRKVWQLRIADLSKKMRKNEWANAQLKRANQEKAATFEDVIKLLHKTFGGNYRALEFFDELYTQKGEDIFKTLDKLSDFEQQLEQKDIKEGVLTRMSENLIFGELLTYLNEEDQDTLFVLSKYNIPVLPMAIGMQRNSANRTASLQKAVDLTLVERQMGMDGRERFYVMPLVRDLIEEAGVHFGFDGKEAGDYHKYSVDENITEDGLVEYQEAFERYYLAGKAGVDVEKKINIVGWKLCEFYYENQNFRLSQMFGLKTEEKTKGKTNAKIYSNIGMVYQLQGNTKQAINYFNKSLEKYKIQKNLYGEGILLNNISQIYIVKGEYDRASFYLERSLKISQAINDRKGEGVRLGNLAGIASKKGEYKAALRLFEKSLKISRETGDFKGELTNLNNIGFVYENWGQYDQALEYYDQSLKISKEIGDLMGESTILGNIGKIFHAKGNSDIALKYFNKNLKISEEIGDFFSKAVAMLNIGGILYEQANYKQAIFFLIHAYSNFIKVGSPYKQNAEEYLALIFEKIGESRYQAIIQNLHQNNNQ